MKKKCKGCGIWFNAVKNQQYCTVKCYQAHYYKQKKKMKEPKPTNLTEIEAKARAKHMSYGKYKAMEYMERMREEQCAKETWIG